MLEERTIEKENGTIFEQSTLGQVRLGLVRFGQVWLGLVRFGQIWLGQVRSVKVKLGQAQ